MNIPMALIYVSGGRDLVPANVERMVQSMKEVGLLCPLVVKPSKHLRGVEYADCYDVVAGRHRFAAARQLGWQEIECNVVELDELQLELAEIDENLIRQNLSPAEEAVALSRRKELYLLLYPDTAAGSAGANARWNASDNLSFASATAKATGKNKRSVERSAARGDELGDIAADVAGTSLDSGVELDALMKLSISERASLTARARAGEKVSARKAGAKQRKQAPDPVDAEQATENQLAALMNAWNKAGPDARQQFLDRVA